MWYTFIMCSMPKNILIGMCYISLESYKWVKHNDNIYVAKKHAFYYENHIINHKKNAVLII